MFLEELIADKKENLIEEFVEIDLFEAANGKGLRCQDKQNMEVYGNIACNKKIGNTYFFYTIDEVAGLNTEDLCIAKGKCTVVLTGLDCKVGNFGYRFSDFEVTKSGTVASDGKENNRWQAFMRQKFGERYNQALKKSQSPCGFFGAELEK